MMVPPRLKPLEMSGRAPGHDFPGHERHKIDVEGYPSLRYPPSALTDLPVLVANSRLYRASILAISL